MFLKRRVRTSHVAGDTLVEVLFATATAALIIVIALVLMNRNLAQIQMGVETTFVRQAIDSQAEVLRYMRDAYMDDRSSESGLSKQWKDLVDSSRPDNFVETQATDFGTCQPDADGNINGNPFYINNISNGASSDKAESDAANIQNIVFSKTIDTSFSETYARPGQGLWVESVNPSFGASPIRYVDFHIRACWDPPFEGPKATLGTIVRLYYETP